MSSSSVQLHFLSSIKRKLQLVCEDLGNITIRDLEQLKWTQKQKIVISVCEHSDFLNSFLPEFVDLQKEKDLQISKLRDGRPEAALERKETEMIFRTRFIRIFLKGLEKQRWPPCLVPFSDPMEELLTNNSRFLEALDYILAIELPIEATQPPVSPKSASRSARTTPRKADQSSIIHYEKPPSVVTARFEEESVQPSFNAEPVFMSASVSELKVTGILSSFLFLYFSNIIFFSYFSVSNIKILF
jgi:hypothetical protein